MYDLWCRIQTTSQCRTVFKRRKRNAAPLPPISWGDRMHTGNCRGMPLFTRWIKIWISWWNCFRWNQSTTSVRTTCLERRTWTLWWSVTWTDHQKHQIRTGFYRQDELCSLFSCSGRCCTRSTQQKNSLPGARFCSQLNCLLLSRHHSCGSYQTRTFVWTFYFRCTQWAAGYWCWFWTRAPRRNYPICIQ